MMDNKKDEFTASEQGGMFVVAYSTQLVTTDEERICLFTRQLNS